MADLSECFGTTDAAAKLGMDAGKLRSFLSKRPDLSPMKIGTALVWTAGDVDLVKKAIKADAEGLCPHCGKPIRAPKVTDAPPAED